jgi:hypothetical protein
LPGGHGNGAESMGQDKYIPSATSADDLYFRLEALRRGGFRPESMVMSPETWRRLEQESAFAITVVPGDLQFDHVPVRLAAKAATVGITYTKVR